MNYSNTNSNLNKIENIKYKNFSSFKIKKKIVFKATYKKILPEYQKTVCFAIRHCISGLNYTKIKIKRFTF